MLWTQVLLHEVRDLEGIRAAHSLSVGAFVLRGTKRKTEVFCTRAYSVLRAKCITVTSNWCSRFRWLHLINELWNTPANGFGSPVLLCSKSPTWRLAFCDRRAERPFVVGTIKRISARSTWENGHHFWTWKVQKPRLCLQYQVSKLVLPAMNLTLKLRYLVPTAGQNVRIGQLLKIQFCSYHPWSF